MRKISLITILVFLVAGFLLPVFNSPALAQIPGQQLNECCRIGSHFKVFDIEFNHKGNCVVGEKSGSCYLNNAEVEIPGDYADDDVTECGNQENADETIALEHWGLVCLLNTVYNVTNWVFYLMMVAVVIFFVIAGAMFMMAGGDTGKTKKAKGMITLAIIGLVIALIAKLIPAVVKMIVGM
ncbi:MAG: pilin [Candidatus Pacebacteria bacterium]|nr:pilin [Candidatus Paceibacterota bacterium]